MKKIFSIIAIMFIAFLLSSCECNHKWEEATCAKPKTCSKCEETEGRSLGHSYSDWVQIGAEHSKDGDTIIYRQKCIRCGKTNRKEVFEEASKLSEYEEKLIDYLTQALDEFKDPSSVKLIEAHTYDIDDDKFYVTLSAENGFGGNTKDVYEVSSKGISVSYREEGDFTKMLGQFGISFSCDISAVNDAIKEYCDNKGW